MEVHKYVHFLLFRKHFFFLASNVSVSTSNLATQKLIVHMNVHTMENIGINFQNVLCISLGCTYILIIFFRFFSHLNSLYTHKSFVAHKIFLSRWASALTLPITRFSPDLNKLFGDHHPPHHHHHDYPRESRTTVVAWSFLLPTTAHLIEIITSTYSNFVFIIRHLRFFFF